MRKYVLLCATSSCSRLETQNFTRSASELLF